MTDERMGNIGSDPEPVEFEPVTDPGVPEPVRTPVREPSKQPQKQPA